MSQKIRKGKNDFVATSNVVHNNKYSYDKVPDSFKVKEKVIITCPIHGDFPQTPDSHKRGCGCPYCGGVMGSDLKKNDEIRTEKINRIIKEQHGDVVRLISLPNKGGRKYKFHCDIHGEFEKYITSINHGQICGECLNIRNRKKLFESELDKMKLIHNDRFEYIDYTDLVSPKTKITIRCKEHDHTFKSIKGTHIQTKYGGCKHCLSQYRNLTTKEQVTVIEQFKNIHGERYGYDNVIYQGAYSKVSITCNKHGNFEQTPGSHLSGSGCPRCKHSTGEKLIQDLLKKMDIKYSTQKSFYGCVNDKTGKSLPFDIYVPEFHTCIEFDGPQHFVPVEKWGGEDNLKEIQYRDVIKNTYCKDNDINLVRIPYTMGKIEITDILNKSFDKDLVVDIKLRTKWIDVNIIERVRIYNTREEFRIKDNTLWQYCYRHKIMDTVCEHMAPKKNRYTYETAKVICEGYDNYTLLEKERSGLIQYVRNNKFFELVEHLDKRRLYWTDDEIIEGLKKYKFKMDVRKNDYPLYSVALKRGHIHRIKDKTVRWTEQMVRDAFKKCRTKTEVTKLYRGADNYARKHNLYDELSSHLVKKI